MLWIWVVAVGRIRHRGLKEAADDYRLRLDRMAGVRLQVVEVREGAGGSQDRAAVMREEGLRLLTVEVPAGTRRVALAADGDLLDTEAFARWLGQLGAGGVPVAFYVGGAWGLSPQVLERCPTRLALSRFTMAHELARVVLLEQLYRAATLLSGGAYHK